MTVFTLFLIEPCLFLFRLFQIGENSAQDLFLLVNESVLSVNFLFLIICCRIFLRFEVFEAIFLMLHFILIIEFSMALDEFEMNIFFEIDIIIFGVFPANPTVV